MTPDDVSVREPHAPRSSSDYQVIIAKYGTRVGRRSEVYLNYALYNEPDSDIRMDYFFWVIRNADRTIVVDTGFSPEGGSNRARTTLAQPADLLARIGVVPTEVEQVVITHAHYDHIGNLGLFPRAEFILAKDEYDFWAGRHAVRRQFHHSVEDSELEMLRSLHQEGRVRDYSGSLNVAPGIELIEIGGHTPGQSAVLVQTAEGPVLLASDAVHYYEELERDIPFMSAANLVQMYEGFDTIRELLANGRAKHLVAGHDPETLERFTPASDPELAQWVATIG